MLGTAWRVVGLGLFVVAPLACGAGAAPPGSTSSGTGGAGTTGSTTSVSGTSTGSGGVVTSSTGTGGGAEQLALPCASDGDCGGEGLRCVRAADDEPVFGGGPASGYCSRACEQGGDCPGGSAVCVKAAADQPGLCLLTCTIGPALMYIDDVLDPGKCHGRADLRCQTLQGSSAAVCLPTCGSDGQCPEGELCDPRSAVCVHAPAAGLPDGSACVAGQEPEACAGVCVSFSDMTTTCARRCALGGEDPLKSASCQGIESGLCLYRPSANGAGDFGYCAPACLAHDDCRNPDFWCHGVHDLTGAQIANGFCMLAAPCPGGEADCTGDPTTTCVATIHGPYCLQSDFPLGAGGGGAPP
jgi:hypothetical protein